MPAQVALATTPPDAKAIAVVRSPALSQIVDYTDVNSYNFFAEMLIKGSRGRDLAAAAPPRRERRSSPASPTPMALASTPSTAPA